MHLGTFKISLGLTLAALAASFAFAAGAAARIPVEPGNGSPVTHVRQPNAKKAVRRNLGGFPAYAGAHVKSAAEARTE